MYLLDMKSITSCNHEIYCFGLLFEIRDYELFYQVKQLTSYGIFLFYPFLSIPVSALFKTVIALGIMRR